MTAGASEAVSLAVPLLPEEPSEDGKLEGLVISGSPVEVAEIARRLQKEGLIPDGVLNQAVRDSGLHDFPHQYRSDLAHRAFDIAALRASREDVRFHASRSEADRYAVVQNRGTSGEDPATVAFPLVANTRLPSGRNDQVTLFVSVRGAPAQIDALLGEIEQRGRLGVVADGGRISEVPKPVVLRICGLAPQWRERVAMTR